MGNYRLAAGIAASVLVATPAFAQASEVIVRFDPGTDRAERAAVHRAEGNSAADVVERIPALGVEIVRVDAGVSARREAAQYEGNAAVAEAGVNGQLRAMMTPNDTYFTAYQWNLRAIGMPVAWDRTQGKRADGTRVSIAVIDTGVAYENYGGTVRASDLADTDYSRFLTARAWDYVDNDSHANDTNGHGTHVAGTIAGTTNNGLGVASVAPEAQLVPIRVLGTDGSGSYSAVAKGILRAAGYNAAGSAVEAPAVDVINLSLGGPRDTSGMVEQAMQIATDRGVTIVAATGNENATSASFPANADVVRSSVKYTFPVLGVGATGYFDAALAPQRAPYSNYGPGLDIYAPGGATGQDRNGDGRADGILQQTFTQGAPSALGYYLFQGTSMATPHVAGAAALVKAQNPTFTPAQVMARLTGTGADRGLGTPVMDVAAATATQTAPPTTPPTTVIAPVNTALPTISGTATAGTTITVSTGTWSNSPTAYTYRWERSSDGVTWTQTTVTSASYAIPVADAGARLRAVVTASNTAGAATVASSAVQVTTSTTTRTKTKPRVSGSNAVGARLVADAGTWSPVGYIYRWQSSRTGLGWETVGTAPSYTIRAADAGKFLRVIVAAPDQPTDTIASDTRMVAPHNAAAPNICPTAVTGLYCYVTGGAWYSAGNLTATVQWQTSATVNGPWANATGAGARTPLYIPATADGNRYLRALVTVTNAGGSTTAASAVRLVRRAGAAGTGKLLPFGLNKSAVAKSAKAARAKAAAVRTVEPIL